MYMCKSTRERERERGGEGGRGGGERERARAHEREKIPAHHSVKEIPPSKGATSISSNMLSAMSVVVLSSVVCTCVCVCVCRYRQGVPD
jgi:hypothetical protein